MERDKKEEELSVLKPI